MDTTLLDRVTRELALRKRLQEALLVFSRGVSARLALDTGLEALAREVERSVRRRPDVGVAARSADAFVEPDRLVGFAAMTPAQERIPTSEDSPIARGLRQEGVQVTGTGASRLLVAPLRGWRRALGTLVIDGPPRHVDDEQLVELSTDLARQLSIAVEGVVVLDELIRQQARLLQSEKLASLGQFIAGIAHEMNNPLQSVLGHLELMIESKEHDAASRRAETHLSRRRSCGEDRQQPARVRRVASRHSQAGRRRRAGRRGDCDSRGGAAEVGRPDRLEWRAVQPLRCGRRRTPPAGAPQRRHQRRTGDCRQWTRRTRHHHAVGTERAGDHHCGG